MKIPLVNLGRLWEQHQDEWTAAMVSVAASSQFILGEEVARFEAAFAESMGAKQAVGVASGTDAVHLALRAAGVRSGDEVITVANTFAATGEAIVHAEARPVLVDVNDDDLLMDCDAVEAAITSKTTAIVPVHLSGRPADMPRLEKIAERHGVALVGDAAQAHGASVSGVPLGRYGIAGAYSFYPGKNLGAFGDAGAVVTNDDEVARKLRSLRDHGRSGKYEHDEVGYGSRLDTLQAAVLYRKLLLLDGWNQHRRRVAGLYRGLLGDRVRLIDEKPDTVEVYHHFMIRIPDRDRVADSLKQAGIGTAIHYPYPLHLLGAFRWLDIPEGTLPVAETAAKEILSLPIDPVITDDEVGYVAEQVLAAI